MAAPTTVSAGTGARTTFRAFWEDRVARSGDATFVVSPEGTFTYREFDQWVNELANGLAAAGARQGDHIAIQVPSSLEMLRMLWAVQKLGALYVPLIPDSTRAETQYVLQHSEAPFLLTDAAHWATLGEGGAPDGMAVFVRGGAKGSDSARDYAQLESGKRTPPPEPVLDIEAPMSIMYTSGSTGKPKGVLMRSTSFAMSGRETAARMGTDETDRWIVVLPLFHGAATHLIIAPAVATGASILMQNRFSRSGFWPDVRKNRGTATLLMPAMLSMLQTNAPQPDDRDNPLRKVFSHVRNQAFADRFDVDIMPGWASTESGGAGALAPCDSTEFPDQWVGTILPAETKIKVCDPAGDELPSGQAGELVVWHPDISLGYYKDPKNTEAAFRDGWLYTGDLGVLDERGHVYYHGRIKNMIKRSGENVAGEEVEFTIMDIPAVEDCVVRGVPDPIRTEEVFATVSVREGHTLTEAEVTNWCAGHLSTWKVPRYVRLVRTSLPKLPNDKLDRVSINAAADPASAWDRQASMEQTKA